MGSTLPASPAVQPTRRFGDVSTAKTTLLLLHDNRLLCDGVAALLRTQSDLTLIGIAADGDDGVRRVQACAPDLVLVGYGAGGDEALLLVTRLRAESPSARIIVIDVPPQPDGVAELVRTGVSGFVLLHAAFAEFLVTVRAVASGAQVLPEALADRLLVRQGDVSAHGGPPSPRLTRREQEVVELLGEGLSNKEIAIRLHVAVHTVKSHVHSLLAKLSLHSRLEVAAFLQRDGGIRTPNR